MAGITRTHVCSTHAPSRVLIMKECWSLTKLSFCIFWSDMWFLPLSPFMWWIIFIDLHMLNHLWIPGLIPTWSWLMMFWMCYSIWFAGIYWEFLHVQRLACNFCCYCCVFIWFWYWGTNGLEKLDVFFLSLSYGLFSDALVLALFLMPGTVLHRIHLALGFCFLVAGRCLISASTLVLTVGLFNCFLHLGLTLICHMHLNIKLFLLDFPI